uniref:Uncharacterized protein n=1 Tax=Rhizobium rhizogenes TaxID=359 RepID=A0A4P8DJY9_RHIRH|nr:hypothetical protein pOC-C5.8_617 [Rhizobium rhizogenes]
MPFANTKHLSCPRGKVGRITVGSDPPLLPTDLFKLLDRRNT